MPYVHAATCSFPYRLFALDMDAYSWCEKHVAACSVLVCGLCGCTGTRTGYICTKCICNFALSQPHAVRAMPCSCRLIKKRNQACIYMWHVRQGDCLAPCKAAGRPYTSHTVAKGMTTTASTLRAWHEATLRSAPHSKHARSNTPWHAVQTCPLPCYPHPSAPCQPAVTACPLPPPTNPLSALCCCSLSYVTHCLRPFPFPPPTPPLPQPATGSGFSAASTAHQPCSGTTTPASGSPDRTWRR